jgi:predicted deacylase
MLSIEMHPHQLPLTYEECRARFRRAAGSVGARVDAELLDARGPHGLELSMDVVTLGSSSPTQALVVLSGVHGVEGFLGSALQSDLVARSDSTSWPAGMAVLVVHAVNPWGMAWWRRQNESNVDLNRNWRRSVVAPLHNDAYDELHPMACPDTDDLPSVDELLVTAQTWVNERGLEWVRDGITVGQYRHPDGLHYGGERTEQSTAILERVIPERLEGVEQMLTIDLHTGHGPYGELTALSNQEPGSPQDRLLRSVFERVEATTSTNSEATTATKSGAVANGLAEVVPDATCFATALEFGTVDALTQLGATYQEQWVHRRGDRSLPEHAAAVWAYRCCFTPDDVDWAAISLERGRDALDRALDAVADWS